MRANRKRLGVLLVTSMVVGLASASTWNQDVAVGAKWSDAANWSTGVPTSADTAIFNQTQANTLDVDVDIAGMTRLQQVQQNHTFNGVGGVNVTAAPAAHFQNIMYNTASSVTYNVPVSIKTTTAYYGQSSNNSGGTTIFNSSYTLESGSLMNLNLGTRVFNGDLNLNGTLRLGSGTTVIGGTGTTAISADYILTAGAATELQLNRTGAYTLVDPVTGYLRVEKTRVVFGATQALGAGTNVKLYELDAASALVSGGDYDQDFGYLACFGNGGTIDMANSASTWTFGDSSAQGWVKLDIDNVDVANTVIRFALGSGGGLTTTQIGQITLNGTALTPGDTTTDGGYLYVTQAIPEPATLGLIGFVSVGLLAIRRFFRA